MAFSSLSIAKSAVKTAILRAYVLFSFRTAACLFLRYASILLGFFGSGSPPTALDMRSSWRIIMKFCSMMAQRQ